MRMDHQHITWLTLGVIFPTSANESNDNDARIQSPTDLQEIMNGTDSCLTAVYLGREEYHPHSEMQQANFFIQ